MLYTDYIELYRECKISILIIEKSAKTTETQNYKLFTNNSHFTAKLREAFLFQVPNSFGIFLITFAILKNPLQIP